MSAPSREWLLEKDGFLMQQLEKFAPLIARVFIGGFFLMAGLGKLADVQGFAGYVTMGGLPAFLAWPAIIFEILVGASLLVGFKLRLVALAGAAFCVVTAVLYHNNFSDQIQMIMFLKNFSIAGAFLMFFAHGAGAYALDKNAA
ncbi:DoxX family protein [Roseobacter sp. HKCCD5988]|uniref:DoxX family protein n=1 Tax=Roseobacter sp. HKCCD5988 TaxID=3120338 RepID=UPI0030ECC96E